MDTPHHAPVSRRALLVALAAVPVAALAQKAPTRVLAEVWKDPSCGCCKDWVSHLQQNGFAVKVNESGNTAMRARLGLPAKFGSCHTALVGGYAIEGHVPAADIRRLLQDKPEAIGLAVPGMPVGSPGMDGKIYGDRRDPYDVLLVKKSGDSVVYASYNRQALSDGEVRRVDKAVGKVTLKHGEIRNLDMPPMTMVFGVRDKALLDGIRKGDRIRFTADKDADGQYVLTSIEAGR